MIDQIRLGLLSEKRKTENVCFRHRKGERTTKVDDKTQDERNRVTSGTIRKHIKEKFRREYFY